MTNGLIYSSRITGIGSYLPKKLITNFDLEKMVDTSDAWIRERTGIVSRHIADDEEATSDLAYQASLQALKMAGKTPEDIDMILVATATPDQIIPSTACVLQHKLGAGDCMALDISAACSGFVYGLAIADQFIRTGPHKTILLVGAEVLHRFVNYKDRNTCILFADGAGAVIVTRSEEDQNSKIYSHHLHADGKNSDLIVLPGGGSVHPISQETLDNDLQYIQMKGHETFKNAVYSMNKAFQEALNYNNLKVDEIDWVIPHQANIRIIGAVAKQCEIPMDKMIVEIEDMGNISAASIPVALDRAICDGRVQRGQHILLIAFGGGITSGSLLMRF